jgi:tRNA A37 methylthiotransferase MiaB
MKRSGSGERHLALIESIRSAAPQAALRSSFIVGFPGETEEHVEALAEFLQAARLDWAGFFPFSPEEGTPAAHLAGQVDEDAVAERLRYVHTIQDDITTSRNLAQVGREFEILVDQVEDGQPVGRSYRQAPEIDGVVLLDRGHPGEWVTGKITGGYGTDLVAEVIG